MNIRNKLKYCLAIILILAITLPSSGQKRVVDKAYVNNWILACDSTIEVDSVQAYYVDRELFESHNKEALTKRLRKISISRIQRIWYSRMKIDDQVPGKGTIHIMTVAELDPARAGKSLAKARELFNDNYTVASQHILTDAYDPVLVIDGKAIRFNLAKVTLDGISPNDIYDISVNNFFPAPRKLYGQNSKNGIVQIWTKGKFKK